MNNPRVLVSPLNWGLGHASRCVPIIRALQKHGAEVLIGADGEALELLKKEFPQLTSITIPDYKITYPRQGSMAFYFFRQLGKMRAQIRLENDHLQGIIEEGKIDAIISDNRYGLYNNSISSVFITHQLNPRSPWLQNYIGKQIQKLIRPFDHCWVPDVQGTESLSGDLSRKSGSLKNISHIGPLSRFKSKIETEKTYEVLAILSGPEPHRTEFEKLLIDQLKGIPGKHVLVTGKVESRNPEMKVEENISVFNLLAEEELSALITKSRYLIARSGYSSIMDFSIMGLPALLVPTPGQYEQEYLAGYHKKRGRFVVCEQHKLDLKTSLSQLDSISTYESEYKPDQLERTIIDFLDSLY